MSSDVKLVLGDSEDAQFTVSRKPTAYSWMKLARIEKKGSSADAAVALFDLIEHMLSAAEYERFDEYMSTDEDGMEKLSTGISKLTEEWYGRPTEESSDSSSSSTTASPVQLSPRSLSSEVTGQHEAQVVDFGQAV